MVFTFEFFVFLPRNQSFPDYATIALALEGVVIASPDSFPVVTTPSITYS